MSALVGILIAVVVMVIFIEVYVARQKPRK